MLPSTNSLVLVMLLVAIANSSLTSVTYHGKHKQVCQPVTSDVTVRIAGCQERTVYGLKHCAGTCLSVDKWKAGERKCTCCKPSRFDWISVEVHCLRKQNWVKVTHDLKQHVECVCMPCND